MIKDFNKTAIIAGERKVSYTEMLQRITMFAGHTPQERGSKTIILSENREGWVYAFFSIWKNHGIAVPVDATSTVEDVLYIMRDCTPQCVWTSRKCEEVVRRAALESRQDIKILIIDDYELADCTCSKAEIDYKAEDTAVIIYTSGTTGSPKGVMLSFENLWANQRGVADEVPIFNEHRRTMVLLPVHHILPLQGTIIIPIICGGGIAICPTMTGPDIMDTLCRGQVGIFIGVPRLWQTLYFGIKKKIDASFVTRTLFNICAKANSPKLSKTIFKSIQQKMGGHLDFCVSGGAALDKEIGKGLRTLGLDVLEGYGMTETAPIIAFTRPGDIIPGCVGLPLPSVECKIVDGELCARGINVMQGYYNRPEETAAVIDKDGFIHTGDLAEMDSKGRVYITGRKKEIIVLSNGKNVQPNEIEYKLETYSTQIKEVAITDKDDMLVAIIVPQDAWADGRSDAELEQQLKREVIEPYNTTVENYKKVMRIFVYHNDLPRTRMDKIQRFKLKDILSGNVKQSTQDSIIENEPQTEEYRLLKQYIEAEKKLPVHPTDHIESDLAFDSLDKVGLQGFIEQTFGMQFNADTMAAYANVEAMAEHIASQKTKMELEETDWNSILNQDTQHLELPSTAATFSMATKAFRAYLRMHNRLSISGTENIPSNGPFIIAPNHQSYIDGPIAMSGIPRHLADQCYFYVTEEHVGSALRKALAKRHNMILMERQNLKNSILKLAAVLKQGKNIIIFPEGSRTHDGKMTAFKKTFAILSKELNVPIVPVCINGAYDAMPRGQKKFSTHPISVEYLTPVVPTPSSTYESITTSVQGAIQQKLSED